MGAKGTAQHNARAARLRAPYVCDECVNDDGSAVVHTPALPYDTPPSGVHYSPRTGAWVAWRTTPDGRTYIVRESGIPRLDAPTFGRERNAPTFHAFTPRACAACRAYLSGVVGRSVPTYGATCVHNAAHARTVRVWHYDPWDGVRASRAFLARYNAHARYDARDDALRERDADAATPTPHDCDDAAPTPRTPHALPHGGVDVRITCRRDHGSADANARCRRECERRNAPLDARRAAQRRATLRARRARAVALDARDDAPYGVRT